MKTKFIFVTGGVLSSLGKGICAASLGRLLKARDISVTIQKFDPYINVDPGTMNPFQHGEVFVTEDGGETWSTPELIDEPENEYVPEEFKASDVCGFGASWMNEDDGYAYFAQLLEGTAPEAPTITGETEGDVGTPYPYTFVAVDPDDDDIAEFLVDWGDGNQETIMGPFGSGEPATKSHTFSIGGTLEITARAKDVNGLIGPEGSLTVTMPRSRTIDLPPILKFLQNYPILFKIIQHLFGL